MDYLKSWVLCGLMAVSFTAFGQIYDGLEFVGPASDCALTPDFSDAFNIAPPIVSGQNTTDTQSKLSIGDIDCDGIPDVIFVSKWAQAIKVMATTDNQPLDGADEGDIKSEYNTPGKKIFPTGKGFDSQWYFEMEIAIGNIDGACDLSNPEANPAEIFAFASNRKNADDIPSNFALTGFNYSGATLEPIPGWCDQVPLLGNQRPGEMGLADFDGDGLVEIFFKNVIYSAETGCLLAQGPALDWDTEVTSAPVAVDLIPGGNMELVSGNIVYSVPDLSAARAACDPCTQSYAPASLSVTADMNSLGQGQWYPKEIYDPNEYGYDNFSSTSVADVNNDGYLDVVLSGALDSKNGETAVFYWDVQNSIVSYYLPKDPTDPTGLGWEWGTSRPNLGEIDGDGKLEITFIAGNQLYALEEVNGVLVEKWLRTINDSRSGIVATTVYDFNNDGNPEIVYRDSQQLTIIDGATGQETLWATTCQSHTMTEGPVIADVNGDGQTDLCVACNRNNSFDINAGLQQQALGEMRCFFSESNSWLPTRQVWNQTGYFITNVTDDLTIPTEQVGMNTVLSDGSCPNGLPGPQKPFNTFMNQVPYLNADGCPVFPGPDLAFFGADPMDPALDPTDPNYFPAIELIPPTCGDFGLTVLFNIINDGDLPITDNIDVSFWEGDPTTDTNAKLLSTDILGIVALGVGDTIRTASKKFTGPGYEFPLYIVLNDNGSTAPIIDLTAKLTQECSIDNNVLGVMVTPEPYEILAQMTNNFTCDPFAPTNGQITSQVFKNGIQITTFTDYKFEWFSGANYETLLPGATGPTISGLPAGDYSLKVTNTVAGCVSSPDFPMTILDDSPQPDVTLVKNSDQTNCTPANGELELVFGGTDIGYTFKWYDQNLTLLPNTAKILTGLVGGTYTVEVILDGCVYSPSETVTDLSLNPEASAVATGVSSCIDPNTGTVTATALESGVAAADQTNFTFDWHYSSDGVANVGSILPPANGTGATRTALPIGFYAVYVTNNTTSCQSLPAFVEVTDDTTFPDVAIYEIQPQTSCDPTAPNGILGAQILDAFGNPIADISTFTFEWFEGDNTLPANLHTITSGTKGEIAENIKGGGIPYTVKVTNPNGCFTSTFFVISEQNTPPEVTLTLLDPNTVCDPVLAALGQFTGRIQATVTDNGVPVTLPNPDYVFTW
ncbi:MAG: VCBS repeat-containing protein, partial [Cyclobacteriaceae bacterium]|nr:VCBS repeat-containing protein [Cyclobacteriaceae bacterium]